MTGAGCPPGHVTSDVTAAFLSHQPATRGKATSTTERQQSLAGGHYGQYGGRPEDGDVRLAGNDYFHQHRRHQFRQAAAAPLHHHHHQQQQAMVMPGAALELAGTCRGPASDVEHIYESPNHDALPPYPGGGGGGGAGALTVTGSYCSEHELTLVAASS